MGVSLGLLVAITVIHGCRIGWESFDGSCYFVSDLREDWPTASVTCGLYHAHLAEVLDANEDTFLKQLISKYHAHHSHDYDFWLGGADTFVEGDWRWMDTDQRMNYTNWYPGEPNNLHSRGEDCLVTHTSGSTHVGWKDRECSSKHYFICEIGGGSGAIVIG